ncbi:Uncharacterized protein YjiK [Salegentibacter echinorum]|uniref:Uncharacterized protein YjiK n=1 Tax=Salegentibacter echinorum TaxID=1073325 RepID=A0A1M5M2F6_SALEC|nr:SdiA-regulated domain-containing protein [Salegentibacter echinorum]SHG71416.1 Uncharacterized protein YjiK [Salegentibacter echinorum]
MNRIVTGIVLGVLCVAGLIMLSFNSLSNENKKDKKKTYSIVTEWRLPEVLDEVSGIDWLGDNRLACIQDEDGVIFIFNLKTSKIEKEITFAGHGDYEDIRVIDEDAYVLRSDGTIFKVSNFRKINKTTTKIETFLTEDHNMESLARAKNDKALLLVPKNREPEDDSYKGIYRFSLAEDKLEETPIQKLQMKDPLLADLKGKLRKKLQPSAVGLNPVSKEYYILDGRSKRLIIANEDFKLKKLHFLAKKDFKQAEGITFSEDGTVYISNEGKGGKANILEIALK